MKTMKTFAILTLVATLSLVPMSSAWAHHRHHHHSHSGAIWGAAVGGTMLGIVMSGIANQPRQASQPQVVVVQPPAVDAPNLQQQQQYLSLELERERARNLALERELIQLRATSQ